MRQKDKINYETTVNAFIKQEEKLNEDLSIQKSLLTFAKDVISAVKKRKKKECWNNSGKHTRRTYKHRGAGPSQMGRQHQ